MNESERFELDHVHRVNDDGGELKCAGCGLPFYKVMDVVAARAEGDAKGYARALVDMDKMVNGITAGETMTPDFKDGMRDCLGLVKAEIVIHRERVGTPDRSKNIDNKHDL